MITVVNDAPITSIDKVTKVATTAFEDPDMSDPKVLNQSMITLNKNNTITNIADVTDAVTEEVFDPSVLNQSVQFLTSFTM